MRHQKNKVTLDRKTAARRSLLANLAESLIIYEKIKTTKAKGVERLCPEKDCGFIEEVEDSDS